jgi:hypothetical protein
MGRHKGTEKRSYIPRQNNNIPDPFRTMLSRQPRSNMTLEEALGPDKYKELLERQSNK